MILFTPLSHLFAGGLSGSAQCGGGSFCATGLPVASTNTGTFTTIFQIVFGILAAICVLMIVLAGLRFITGRENPQEIAKARNTIIYALIGLVVAIVAEGLVSFVLGNLG